MLIHVKAAKHIQDYTLRIEFSNGVVKDVDLSGELYGEVFAPLNSLEIFEQLRVDEETRTVTWPNGADFAPEYLYEIGRDVTPLAKNAAA